jgi:hypothetical protein
MGEDRDADSMTEIYAQNVRIRTAKLNIINEPATAHLGGPASVLPCALSLAA